MFRATVQFSGAKRVLGALTTRIGQMKKAALSGIVEAQREIRADMDSVSPLIPVDLGNLRKSYFCVDSNGKVVRGVSPKFKNHPRRKPITNRLTADHGAALSQYRSKAMASTHPMVYFGFSAWYAPFIHEAIAGRGFAMNWKRPGSGAKFLQAAVRNKQDTIPKIVAEKVKFK